MGILKILFVLLVVLFPLSEVGRLQFANGVAITVNDLFLGLVVIIWFFQKLLISKKYPKGFLAKPILIFLFISFLSLVLNALSLNLSSFLISFLYLVRFFAYVSIYFVLKDFDAKFKTKISYLLVFSGLATVLLGYIQYFFYPNLKNLFYLGWDDHLYRMFSSFLDPNFAGAFFSLFFFYLISFLKENISKKKIVLSLFYGLSSLLTLGAVYLTYSRSALLMLVTGVIVYLILISRKRYILVAVAILVLLIFIAPKSFQTEGTNLLRVASSEKRFTSAGLGVKIFNSSPIYGVGFNAYRYAQNRLGGMNNQYWQTTHSGGGTDNSLLFVLATTGVIGLISFLFILFNLFILGKNNLKKNKYSLVLISVLLGVIVDSLFINSFFYVFILEWIWILAAFTENS